MPLKKVLSVPCVLADRDADPNTTLVLDSSSTTSAPRCRLITPSLKLYKRLEIALGKFTAKLNGIAKTNILRTLLLPFLRFLRDFSEIHGSDPKLRLSLASISTSVLGLWWRLLLSALKVSGSQHVPAVDRSAYLECISRIMARHEWLAQDDEIRAMYRSCLLETLDYCISRLLYLKIVPISVCAFVGKVFAYAYFHLPGVANALLFLLNVKQKTLDKQATNYAAVPSETRAHAASAFPPNVTHLIDYRGITNLERLKKGVINCIPPPQHPVRGIKDPSGPWVRFWCSPDSDVFNLFFRHYVNIADFYMGLHHDIPPHVFPGFQIIASFIYQNLLLSINKILVCKSQVSSKQAPSHQQSKQDCLQTNFAHKQLLTTNASIVKLLQTIRDICYSEIACSDQISRAIDQILANIACSMSLFDINKTGILLNLVYEYSLHLPDTSNIDWGFWLGCNYLMLTRTDHVQIVTKSFAFLFNIWDRIPGYLTKYKNSHPKPHLDGWFVDSDESYKLNFALWIISSPVWLLYFIHWNPLVRSYYSRLIVWRVIGVNNYENSRAVLTTRNIKRKADFLYERVYRALSSKELPATLKNLDFTADLPIVNRKFGVVPINNRYSYIDDSPLSMASVSKHSDLRKTHAYEIFDEAIYTCASLPGSQETRDSDLGSAHGDNSLITSLGRFFKKLAAEEPDGDQLSIRPPQKLSIRGKGLHTSKSANSLISLRSLRSMSSTPSVPSFVSSSNSSNDHSAESSATSGSDTSSLLSDCLVSSTSSIHSGSSNSRLQPPELSKFPPEVLRSVFKLDIVIDHELYSSKYAKMQAANRSEKLFFGQPAVAHLSFVTLPKPPKVPSISIMVNLDAYNKFYIDRDDITFDDELLSEVEVKDLQEMCDAVIAKLSSPTSLVTIGKALNEWNLIVDEFEKFLFDKVEADQAFYLPLKLEMNEMTELEYFARIMPFLPIDNYTELKLLNAA